MMKSVRRRLGHDEAGYSMVEVVVAILLLSIAIIPMVSMFDAGLRAAVLGGNYDKGRALANANLEEAKARGYENAEALASCPYDPSGSEWDGFNCDLTTKAAHLEPSTGNIVADGTGTLLHVTVEVSWNSGDYKTSGILAPGGFG